MNFMNVFAVDVLSLDGQLIGNWPSIRGACKAIKIKYNNNINKCLSGNPIQASGYIWRSHPIEIPRLEGEEWKPVVGLENLFAVSNKGRVASIYKKGRETFSILSQHVLKGKYNTINFWINSKRTMFYVHRLVAEAFIPNPLNLPEVNHKDENGLNNFVWVNPDGSLDPEKSNLEWCDRHYNLTWGTRSQRFADAKSIPILQLDKQGNLIKEWRSQKEICDTLHVDGGSLSHALKGWRINQKGKVPVYTYHGYVWKYK